MISENKLTQILTNSGIDVGTQKDIMVSTRKEITNKSLSGIIAEKAKYLENLFINNDLDISEKECEINTAFEYEFENLSYASLIEILASEKELLSKIMNYKLEFHLISNLSEMIPYLLLKIATNELRNKLIDYLRDEE